MPSFKTTVFLMTASWTLSFLTQKKKKSLKGTFESLSGPETT